MRSVTASPSRFVFVILGASIALAACGDYDDKVPGGERPDTRDTADTTAGDVDATDVVDTLDSLDSVEADTADTLVEPDGDDTSSPGDTLDVQDASPDDTVADVDTTPPDPCPQGEPCDDGSACTLGDRCDDHVCVGTPRACDDQNACNGTETCDPSLGCVAGAAVDCSAKDGVCARGTCDPATGACSAEILPDASPCDDGDLCTLGDTCTSGHCTAASTVVCTARDDCHLAGACNPASGTCEDPARPDGATCDDGVACSLDDRCVGGTCLGSAKACDDGVACSVDACDEGSGACVSDVSACGCDDDADCDDQNLCNGRETCGADLLCHPGVAVSCAQLDAACEVGACLPATGLCESRPRPDGTTCDDGSACTTNDLCTAGLCRGSDKTCLASDACHAPGTCNPATGACTDPLRDNGTPCDDGLRCTTNDLCTAGVCGGSAVSCAALDACHVAGSCDPATGQCSNPDAPDQTACNDASACTRSDVCLSGTCIGQSPVVCTASDACHLAGSCDRVTGACSNPAAPNGTSCSDLNACTDGDACQAGSCTPGTPRTCTSSNPCLTNGLCDPGTGQCTFSARPEGTSCSDGDACTSGDRCVGTTCTPTGQVVCAALDQCHVAGVCNSTTGQCTNPNKPNNTSCSLGTCSTDTCQNGTCTAGATTCYPGQVCTTGVCTCEATATSFNDDVKPIFSNNCSPCHVVANAEGGSSGLNLSPQFAYAELVEVDAEECNGAAARKRVKTDTPNASYLMHKTRGLLLCSGSRMPPPPAAALSAAQLATIGRWICQGAKNN